MLLEINGILPATIIYSFLMSFFFLYYFGIIFIIATLHLTLVFLLPVIIFMVLYPEDEDIAFENDVKNSTLAIEIVTMTNHVLNKLVYPFCIVYYESGFLSLKYKNFPITCKGWIYWVMKLWIIPAGILLAIALFIFKDEILGYYNNVLVFYLNYLNIFDLNMCIF